MRRPVGLLALLVISSFLVSGCGDSGTPSDAANKPSAEGKVGVTPDASVPDPHKELVEEGAKVDFVALEKAQTDADAAFKKAPKDDAAKKTYVEATVKLATETMEHSDLPPREKYRKALNLYRAVLKTDPENEEAKVNSRLIEDIYKSMGRPVPE